MGRQEDSGRIGYALQSAIGHGKHAKFVDGAKAILRLLARDQDNLHRAAIERAEATIGNADAHFDQLFSLYQMLVDQKVRRAI